MLVYIYIYIYIIIYQAVMAQLVKSVGLITDGCGFKAQEWTLFHHVCLNKTLHL